MAEVIIVTATGIAIALPIALFLTRYLKNQLYEVQAMDSVTIFASVAALLIVALIAGFIPAFRATRIDPVTALRWQ